jgi:hypothetical protein
MKKKKPRRFCERCKKMIPQKQTLQKHVCLADDCMAWWNEEEIPRRQKERNRKFAIKAKKKREKERARKKEEVVPTRVMIVKPKEEFCQRVYEAQQKAIRNNGRQCLKCGELTGGVNYYCERHRREINAIAGHSLELEGEDMQRHSFSGVM